MEGQPATPRSGPVTGALTEAVTALDKALTEHTWAMAEADLGAALESLDVLRRDLERLSLRLVAEAGRRGTATSAGASSLTDWVAALSPSLRVQDAHQLVTVATACDLPCHAPLADELASGALPVRKAARVLSALAQIKPFVSAQDYVADQHILIPLAVTGTDRDLTMATRHLVAVAAPERDTERLATGQRQARSLTERPSAGGMTEFLWRLDPEGTAIVRAALSPLARPVPDADGPDPRSPAQRRSDALLTVVGRGVGAPGEVPTTAKAQVVVTIGYDQLVGRLTGLATTMSEEQLSPATVRRVACDADILPVVLGSAAEVLDQGRAVRLATPAQHKRLWMRDKGCTYPGCSIPAQWCDAHHVEHWSRGGPTNLSNLALLCRRHHTVVHDRDLMATVTAYGVTWHT
jgi:hypothetical protein